jgi:hypothetical protein
MAARSPMLSLCGLLWQTKEAQKVFEMSCQLHKAVLRQHHILSCPALFDNKLHAGRVLMPGVLGCLLHGANHLAPVRTAVCKDTLAAGMKDRSARRCGRRSTYWGPC